MPPLNEGDLMFMPVTDPAIGLPQAIEIAKKQNAAIARCPEVAGVVAKIARAETSTDPAPVNMTETIVNLKPEAAVAPGHDAREAHRASWTRRSTLPGVANIWTQPIINRINMLTTGIRSEVGVKVFGSDLKVLEERARAVADALRQIPGAADVYPEQVTGAPYLDIRVNREAAARYGIRRRRHPGRHRDRRRRDEPHADDRRPAALPGPRPLRRRDTGRVRRRSGASLVTAPNGTQVPLAQLADIRQVDGPSMIASENGLLVVTVLLNVRGRDVGSFVEEARQVVADQRAAAAGLLHRVERPVRERGPRAPAADGRDPARPRGHLRLALPDVPLLPRGGSRPPGRALCAVGRHLSARTRSGTTSRSPSGSGSSRCSARRSRRRWSW